MQKQIDRFSQRKWETNSLCLVDLSLGGKGKFKTRNLNLALIRVCLWHLSCSCVSQVCQIRVMPELATIMLIQDGAVDFKTITISLFPKFHRQLFFFFRYQNLMQCLHSRSPRNELINQKRPSYWFIEFDMIKPDTFL